MAVDPHVRAGTLIRKFMKGAEDAVSRKRIVFAKMKQLGRIEYNQGGDGFQWQVEFRRAAGEVNDGTGTVTPTPVDRYRTCFLDYEGTVTHDRITKREKLKGGNPGSRETLIHLFSQMGEELVSDLEEASAEDFYVDGPANAGRVDGAESFLAYTQTINIANWARNGGTGTTAARAANVADPFAYPSDTYATRSTILGNIAGSWGTAGPWPFGTGQPEFDYFTPHIVRGKSSFFGGTTWEANAVKATRLGLLMNKRNKPPKVRGHVDSILMAVEMFYDYANKLDSKERVAVSQAMRLPNYGLEQDQDAIKQDGASISWEYGVPGDKGYGLNWNCVNLKSMQDRLWVLDPDTPRWHGESRSWVCIADFLGQWKFHSPRNFILYDASYSN